METPERLFFVGNSPQGGKLRAHFQGKNLPSSIKIKGTNDNQPVKLKRNNKGVVTAMWSSKNKYTTRMQTLQFYDCGRMVLELKYDSCGDVVIENPKATINGANSSISTTNGVVNFVWTSVEEEAVDQYCSEKRPAGSGEWDAFEGDEPTGAGSVYTAVDQPAASARLDYRLRAIFNDGTDTVLLEKTLDVVVPSNPDAVINAFTAVFNPETGYTDLNWTVVSEVLVIRYNVMRKDPGGSAFNLAFSVSAGVGSQSYQNQTDEPGNYEYQIIPVYVGEVVGPVKASATSTVPAVV